MKKYLLAALLMVLVAPAVWSATLPETGGDEENPYERRMRFLDKAKAGDVDASYEVGMTFCCGKSEYHDVQKATWWLCDAARKNNVDAQYMIGELYRSDRAITLSPAALQSYPQLNDDVLAYVWMKIAQGNGSEKAGKEWQQIKARLSAPKLREAESMVPFFPYVPCEIEVGDTENAEAPADDAPSAAAPHADASAPEKEDAAPSLHDSQTQPAAGE
jgi:TPR repeat protein